MRLLEKVKEIIQELNRLRKPWIDETNTMEIARILAEAEKAKRRMEKEQ